MKGWRRGFFGGATEPERKWKSDKRKPHRGRIPFMIGFFFAFGHCVHACRTRGSTEFGIHLKMLEPHLARNSSPRRSTTSRPHQNAELIPTRKMNGTQHNTKKASLSRPNEWVDGGREGSGGGHTQRPCIKSPYFP